MTTENNSDGTDSTSEKPELNDQGYVKLDEFPSCPNCSNDRFTVSKSSDALSGLHCRECGRILQHFQPADISIDDEDKHFAVVGEKAHGTGKTEEEAVENMKEYLDEDAFPVYSVYVSNRPLQVSRYGQVIGEEGSNVILHFKGKERLQVE